MKKIFSLRFLAIIIFLLTLIYLIIEPKYLFKDHNLIIASEIQLIQADQYDGERLKQTGETIIFKKRTNQMSIAIYNPKTKYLSEYYTNHTTLASAHGSGVNNFFYDPSDNCTYTVFVSNGNHYQLAKIAFNDSKGMQITKDEFFVHDIYEELQDTINVIDGIKFFKPVISDDPKIKIDFIQYKDGYKLVTSSKIIKEILHGKVSEEIINYYKAEFSDILAYDELYPLATWFMRNSYYQSLVFSQPHPKNNGFFNAIIIGRINVDEDSHEELLIYIIQNRWIKGRLIAYDELEKTIKWQRKFNCQVFGEILDVDSDSIDDIVITTYSNRAQIDIDQDEWSSKFPGNEAVFTILDNQGNFKKRNGKEIYHKTNPGFFKFHYHLLPETSKIILGLSSRYNNEQKNLLLYDIEENKISKLDIEYQHCYGFLPDKDNLMFFKSEKEILQQVLIDKNLNGRVVKTLELPLLHSSLLPVREIFINNQKYFELYNANILYDTDFKPVTDFGRVDDIIHIGNTAYMISREKNYSFLKKVEFSRNRKLNPWTLLILLSEISILLVILSIRYFITIPLHSSQSSYLVLYSFFDKLHYWKIYGQLAEIHNLPKKVSIYLHHFQSVLRELSTKEEVIYSRNLGLYKLKAYRLKNWDEFQIIQRIAHDLKNKVLSIKMATSIMKNELYNGEIEEIEKLVKGVDSNLEEISNITLTLSRLSHLNKLYFENLNYCELINDIVASYLNNQLFDNIKLKLCEEDIYIKADKKLISSAFKNLINNAIQEITLDQFVVIELYKENNAAILKISNPGYLSVENINEIQKIGFSTKENGTGIGIPITKMIIEKHQGNFQIFCHNNNIVIEINMKMIKG